MADVITSRASFIVADMIVVVVTWLSWKKGMTRVAGAVPTLSNVLMYNGQSRLGDIILYVPPRSDLFLISRPGTIYFLWVSS